MNFDDIKHTWQRQHFCRDDGLAGALLAVARTRERRFRMLALVAVVRDAALFGFIIGSKLMAQQAMKLPSAALPTVVTTWFAGTALLLAYSRSLTDSLVGGIGALASRVTVDSGRFRRLMLWRNGREIALGVAVVIGQASRAAQTPRAPGWLWAAVISLGLAVMIWAYQTTRIFVRRPRGNSDVGSAIELSLYDSRAQMEFMSNLGAYFMCAFVAAACFGVRGYFVGFRSAPQAVISVATSAVAMYAMYRLNRWIAARLLRPRVEALERVQEELRAMHA